MPNKYYLQAADCGYNEVCIYICTHNDRDDRQLQADFDACVASAKAASPELWSLHDAFEAMENLLGWKVEPLCTVDVYY